MAQKQTRVAGDDRGPLMADAIRRGERLERFRQGARDVAGVDARDRRHRQVRDLDATEAVAAAELDAGPEAAVGGEHPAARILAVGEAAERLRLELGRAACAWPARGSCWCSPRQSSMRPRGK